MRRIHAPLIVLPLLFGCFQFKVAKEYPQSDYPVPPTASTLRAYEGHVVGGRIRPRERDAGALLAGTLVADTRTGFVVLLKNLDSGRFYQVRPQIGTEDNVGAGGRAVDVVMLVPAGRYVFVLWQLPYERPLAQFELVLDGDGGHTGSYYRYFNFEPVQAAPDEVTYFGELRLFTDRGETAIDKHRDFCKYQLIQLAETCRFNGAKVVNRTLRRGPARPAPPEY